VRGCTSMRSPGVMKPYRVALLLMFGAAIGAARWMSNVHGGGADADAKRAPEAGADRRPPGATLDPPEVRQRDPFDCGPAGLHSVLEGYGLEVDYEDLVRLCEVDPREGTSIDKLEAVANQLGLRAEQIMLPSDHVFLPGQHRGPTIAVARQVEGQKHFLVLWRASGELVEVMDPATGQRTWLQRPELLERLYVHEMKTPTTGWNEWGHSAGFQDGVMERMRRGGDGS
jgi:hypothetical protein